MHGGGLPVVAMGPTPQCMKCFHPLSTVSTPVELEEENRGSLEEGEQIRWQFEVPESGALLTLEVDQGEVVFYASTQTTSPNEALHQWKIQTSSSESVFIIPTTQSQGSKKRSIRRQLKFNNMNETLVTVYTTLFGLDRRNTFTLTSSKLFAY